MDRKKTAWKKSRTFGDIFGGRVRPRVTDNIFKRLHSLKPPGPGEQTPIIIEENPSRNYFFPLQREEICSLLSQLPPDDVDGITHVWLRRSKVAQRENRYFAEFICGSGVRVIILYPWPRDLVLRLGAKKPSSEILNRYKRWQPELLERDGKWDLQWTSPQLQDFYRYLLLHEIGHHVDWYQRHWSRANKREVESFADHYAAQWSLGGTDVFSQDTQ